MLANARIIERRLFAYHFERGSSEAVRYAVLAYQNEDGGFGHGLEPDSSSPESQPLFTLMALEYLDEAEALTVQIVEDAMKFLLSVTNPDGGVPWMLPPFGDYQRAAHFDDVTTGSAINPTAPLLAILKRHGIRHAWMENAEEFCVQAIEKSDQMNTGFGCHCVNRKLEFLKVCSDRVWAQKQIEKIMQQIDEPENMCRDLASSELGLFGSNTPLNFAPRPDDILFRCFSTEKFSSYLDAFINAQREDGSWETSYGINQATKIEWDGMFTLWVLKALESHQRIENRR